MNIVFITLLTFNSIFEHNIYCDLLREFLLEGHHLSVFCATDLEEKTKYKLVEEKENFELFHVNTGKIQKTSLLRKGINTLLLDKKIQKVIKKELSHNEVQLIIYTTPPITLVKTISYLKKQKGARTYLLLKDIFPQNCVDLGILHTRGLKSFVYKHFRKIEVKLYKLSDYIGCMSEANVNYIINHNSFIDLSKVEICPNSIDISFLCESQKVSSDLNACFLIPNNKKLLVYGGNLGKPQGIDYLIKCIERSQHLNDVHFVVVGDGTEFNKLLNFSKTVKNFTLIKRLNNKEYRELLAECDIGLLFLDNRFTIPNYPSRLLDYMSCGLPIIACTDRCTDIKKTIEEGNFGCWCESKNPDDFLDCLEKIEKLDKKTIKENERNYLIKNFSSKITYEIIIKHFIL